METITRPVAIANLKKYVGQDLSTLAAQCQVTTYQTGKQNKGWKGLILEVLAGLGPNVSKDPNGLSYEIKSVSFRYVKGILVPKETMAITMINPEELKACPFFESHCWNKLKSMIFCAVMWHGKNAETAELLKVSSLEFSETDDLIQEIKQDYEFIRKKLVNDGFESLTGKDGKWIQPRN